MQSVVKDKPGDESRHMVGAKLRGDVLLCGAVWSCVGVGGPAAARCLLFM